MKSIVRYLIPVAGLAAALPLLRADEDPAPQEHKEMRVIVGPGDNAPPPPHRMHRIMMGNPHEMETVTFLGVSTEPTGPVLADQLNLAKGTGLVVTMVAPDSPAHGLLKPHDVLVKLDDQLLIEQRQLAVLIRNHKEGDEVALTFIRGGKEETVKVKLAKHDVPKMAMLDAGPHAGGFAMAMSGAGGMPGMDREEMDRVLSLMHHGGPPPPPGEPMVDVQVEHGPGPGMHSVSVSTSNSNMVFSDEQGSLDLTIKDGKKTLVAKNAKGEQLFSGPVNTPEERKAMPAEVRARLDKLEDMQDYSFKTDGDFKPGEVKDARPAPHGIGMPLPPAPAAPPPKVF
jgi:serine protease Do